MIHAGDVAPDFTATAADGTPLTLSKLRGRPVILFFFPKAGSVGCTVETRAFAEHTSEFQSAGYQLVGVSVDTVAAQSKFGSNCHVAFPLVSDASKEVARAYGVLGFLGFARRVTFHISAQGRVDEVTEAIGPGPHVRRALERARGPPSAPEAGGEAMTGPGGGA
jgi:thioredoxin-dependent peroxiredoxin